MSRKGDLARIHKIGKYILDIRTITARHGTAENALEDLEGRYALMMCIAQIGELLNKITSVEMLDKLPVRNAVAFRNVIVHNYDGIITRDAVLTLNENIPSLENSITAIIQEFDIIENKDD